MSNLVDLLTRKQRKPRGFNYIPRYYNPKKEEFDKLVNRLRAERDAAEKGETVRVNFKGAFTSKTGRTRSPQQKQLLLYNIRLFLILGILVVVAYNFYHSPKFVHYFNQFFNSLKKKDGLY